MDELKRRQQDGVFGLVSLYAASHLHLLMHLKGFQAASLDHPSFPSEAVPRSTTEVRLDERIGATDVWRVEIDSLPAGHRSYDHYGCLCLLHSLLLHDLLPGHASAHPRGPTSL